MPLLNLPGKKDEWRSRLAHRAYRDARATTSDSGRPRVRSDRYDAALLDINMPGIGGIETCRAIRRLAPRLPILMLTVRDNPDDKIDALDAGADDYVTKPFHVGELMARVRSAVRRSQATQEKSECSDQHRRY